MVCHKVEQNGLEFARAFEVRAFEEFVAVPVVLNAFTILQTLLPFAFVLYLAVAPLFSTFTMPIILEINISVPFAFFEVTFEKLAVAVFVELDAVALHDTHHPVAFVFLLPELVVKTTLTVVLFVHKPSIILNCSSF